MCLNRCCIEKACKSVCADADHLASQQQASKQASTARCSQQSKRAGRAVSPASEHSKHSEDRKFLSVGRSLSMSIPLSLSLSLSISLSFSLCICIMYIHKYIWHIWRSVCVDMCIHILSCIGARALITKVCMLDRTGSSMDLFLARLQCVYAYIYIYIFTFVLALFFRMIFRQSAMTRKIPFRAYISWGAGDVPKVNHKVAHRLSAQSTPGYMCICIIKYLRLYI